MKKLLFLFCLSIQMGWAQPGFNKSFDYGYFVNYFNDVVVQKDTIIAYGLAQDTAWPYLQGVLIARFDTLGVPLDNKLVIDSTNNIYSINKGWGKIIATSDGGYAMTTGTLYGRDGVLIKLDDKLETEFVKVYKDTVNQGEFLVSPIEVHDGFLLFGYYNFASNGKFNAILRKVDKQGNMIWRKNFGLDNWYEAFHSAIILKDSSILINGGKYFEFPDNYPTAVPWICVFNQQGELQYEWQSTSPEAINGFRVGRLLPNSDSTWVANGYRYLGLHPVHGFKRYQTYLVGLNKNFQYAWSKPFGPNNNQLDILLRVVQTPEKDLVGFGQRGPFNSDIEGFYQKGWVMRFSPQGDSLWEWTGKAPIPNPGAHFFSGGALLSSGSIVAAGAGDAENGYPVCWLVKLSPDGCVDTLYCHAISAVEAPLREREGLQLFPNPARDYVNLRIFGQEAEKVALIRLCDLSGRIVREYKFEEMKEPLPLAGLAAGLYFVQIISEKGAVLGYEKLVVSP